MAGRLLNVLGSLARMYVRYSPVDFGKAAVIACRGPFALLRQRRLQATVSTSVGTELHVQFPDMIQRGVYFLGVWEPTISRLLQLRLQPGDTFVDVGANVGYHTCLGAKLVGPQGQVHAVEASSEIAELLRSNIELNDAADWVDVHVAAAVSTDCTVAVHVAPEHSLGTTSVGEPTDHSTELVRGAPLTEIVGDDLLKAKVVKVDIEGAEWDAFQGFEAVLEKCSEQTEWIIEVTPSALEAAGGSVRELIDRFEQAGYSTYSLENRYDTNWYVQQADRILHCSLDELVQPAPDTDAVEQIDLLFTKGL